MDPPAREQIPPNDVEAARRRKGRLWLTVGILLILVAIAMLIGLVASPMLAEPPSEPSEGNEWLAGVSALLTAVAGVITSIAGLITILRSKPHSGND